MRDHPGKVVVAVMLLIILPSANVDYQNGFLYGQVASQDN